MSDFAMPTRLFVSTTAELLVAVDLPTVPHQPTSLDKADQQASLRPFLASGEHEPVSGSSAELAIVIDPLGEITVPDFYGAATPDRLWGHWDNIRRLLHTARPLGIRLPGLPGLAAWIDGQGESRERDANMTASMLIRSLCSAPGSLVYGSLLITGGMPRRPVALTIEQVTKTLDDLLTIELDNEDGEIL